MIVNNILRTIWIIWLVDNDLNDIVNHDEATDYETLSDFKAVNTGVNIDSICAEDCDVAHVEVVEETKM